MQYLISIYGNHEAWARLTDDDIAERDAAHAGVFASLEASGELVGGRELGIVGSKTVRRTTSGLHVVDGPFTEGKEILGGYYIVDCASIERAIEIAGQLTEADYAPIDVRPILGT